MITQELLKQLFDYRDGKLFWKVRTAIKIKIGSIAGNLNKKTGYWYVRVNKKIYKRGRLVFLYHHGRFPEKEIDHINLKRDDDRIENLREANHSLNQINKRGYGKVPWKHINFYKKKNSYRFYMGINVVKQSKDLDYLIQFRNDFLRKHDPVRLEVCERLGC